MAKVRCRKCDKVILKAAVTSGAAVITCECGHSQIVSQPGIVYEPCYFEGKTAKRFHCEPIVFTG